MREFTADEVAGLYAQHAADTGQRFESEACAPSPQREGDLARATVAAARPS